MIARLARLFLFEWRKLLARRLPLVAFVAVLLVALLAPQVGRVVNTASALMQGKGAAADPYANGWTALSGAVGTSRLFLMIVVLLLAGSSLAEETAHGTLQALFVRPVRRLEVVTAKWLALWSYAVVLLVSVVALASLSAELSQGLYDVVDPVYPSHTYQHFRTMWIYVFKATALTILPLAALTSMGLFVSAVIEHPGYATGVAIGGLFFLSTASGLSKVGTELFFVSYLSFPFEVVKDLGAAYTNTESKFGSAFVLKAVLVPLVWTAAFYVATVAAVQRRDITR